MFNSGLKIPDRDRISAPVSLPVGVVWPRRPLSFEAWAEGFGNWQMIAKAIPWVLGDYLNKGDQLFGETYTQAIEWTGYGLERLKRYKFTAAHVPMFGPSGALHRIVGLDWTHHRITESLSIGKQAFWLASALDNNWTTREMADALRGASSGPEPVRPVVELEHIELDPETLPVYVTVLPAAGFRALLRQGKQTVFVDETTVDELVAALVAAGARVGV